jgi:ABC-2 type transport system permease protein
VNEVFEAQTFSNFFRFPMVFLCGLFIPLEQLPRVVRPLSYLFPLTYGADILRFSVNHQASINRIVSFAILLLYAVGLFLVSTHNIKKRWIY